MLAEEVLAGEGPLDGNVIVKPSGGAKCEGIGIVPHDSLAPLAREVANGSRPSFVAQDLVRNVFLFEGRRWDIRLYALATSLSPLEYVVYRQGVARTADVASDQKSENLVAWLTGESYRKKQSLPVVNLPLTEMLQYVETTFHPRNARQLILCAPHTCASPRVVGNVTRSYTSRRARRTPMVSRTSEASRPRTVVRAHWSGAIRW